MVDEMDARRSTWTPGVDELAARLAHADAVLGPRSRTVR
jgi:hypothetical protein